ncbi:DNA mismatch repair protein MutL [Dehalogenimonas lykanthroporepellens BL-DC-9]|nr:DNA mismatch repair protein MutL [Dehalogenimonas lykanthroporepellens BL-DC-9]
MPIQQLDRNTVARIAAGEVVERPASVVKELVENAIDAAAGAIDIEIRDGGTALIRVSDDGIGIAAVDLPLALERHATSKITSFDDLDSLSSLGFRGEALSSIAAVAELEVLTATADESGSSLVSRHGEVTVKTAARARGTTVSVSRLFSAVPARLKFLKTTATETGHVTAVVGHYALARPDIRFTLSVDGHRVLASPGSGRLRDAAAEVLGRETAARMMDIDSAIDSMALHGLVAPPEIARANRSGQYFFVNRRWVKSPMLTRALAEAGHGLLTVGRYPIAVLSLTLPPAETDINIHPAKTEIKFRQDSRVFDFIRRSVRSLLVGESPVPVIHESPSSYRPSLDRRASANFIENLFPPTAPGTSSLPEPGLTVARALPALRPVGQIADCYLLAEGPDGLYIIDQHAAHERVMYEKALAARASRVPASQSLLSPRDIGLSPAETTALTGTSDLLKEFGFIVEDFGGRTVLVRAVPAILADGDWETALHEFLNSPESRTRGEQKMAELIACHSAVRAGRTLSPEEIRALLADLERTDLPATCPHGRPTLMKLETSALERHFKRI